MNELNNMKINVVTTNNDKFAEIANILKLNGIESEQIRLEMIELGETLEEITISKAKQAFEHIKKPVLVDDTGMFFNAYKSFPGIFAKRMYNSLGFDGLLKLLDNKDRSALFSAVVCFYDGKEFNQFRGDMHGHIDTKVNKRAHEQFPYDAIFIPKEKGVPLCEISIEDRKDISHRSIAVTKFCEWFKKEKLS